MQIQVNTDRNVEAREELTREVESDVMGALARFAAEITRVEVHLSDQSAGRSTGQDQRCLLEVRPAGRDPVTVTHHAGSTGEAVKGATERMRRVLSDTFDRLRTTKGGDSIRRP